MASPNNRASISRRPVAGGNAATSPPDVKETRSVSMPTELIDYDIPPALPLRPGDARRTLSSDLMNFAHQGNASSPVNDLQTILVQNDLSGPQDLVHNNGIPQSPATSFDGHVSVVPAAPDYAARVPSPPLSSSSKSQSATEESHSPRTVPFDFARNSFSNALGKGDPLTAQSLATITHANSGAPSHQGLTAAFNIIVEDQGVPTPIASESLSPKSLPSIVTTPIPELPHVRRTEEKSFATVCCQCSCAVPHETFYYRCTFCRLDICGSCFQAGKHAWPHLPSLIRLKAQETKAGDKRQDRHCSSCNSMKHGRLDCDECEHSICSSCFSNEKAGLHEHRSFVMVNPPGLTLSAIREGGPPCCLEPSFGHCGRCCSPWKSEESMIHCKTCLFEFEDVVGLCSYCDTEILSACRQKDHQMVSMKCSQNTKVEDNVPGNQENQILVKCTECTCVFQNMTDIAFLRHPHTKYECSFLTASTEDMFASIYRNCRKKVMREDIPLAPTDASVTCNYCNHKFLANVMQECLDCSQAIKYCPHCFPIASPAHRDGPANFINDGDIQQVKLGGGWTQRKNSEGRIWYQQPKLNKSTFTPPTAINTLSEDKPETPRRATIAGLPSETAARPKPSRAITTPLPPGWEARKTLEGRRYYVCHETKATSWERPGVAPSTNTANIKGKRQRPVSMNPSVPNPQQFTGAAYMQSQQPTSPQPYILPTMQPVPETIVQSPTQGAVPQAAPIAAAPATAPLDAAAEKAKAKADKEAALKKKNRNKVALRLGASVLKGVVSGAIQAAI